MVRLLAACCCCAVIAAADLAEGVRLKQEGRLPEAEAVLRAVCAASPGDADAAGQLATVVGWQGRHAEAEDLWLAAVALRPDDADLRTGLARVRWWRGDADGAQRELDTVLAAHPDHADASSLAGDIARGRRRLGWRADAYTVGERFSAVYGDASTAGAGLAASWRGLGTISTGAQRRWIDGGDETTVRLGLGIPLGESVVAEAGAERTPDPILAARASLSADIAWRMPVPIEVVGGWRRSWFAGDRVDLYRPGLRWHPVPEAWAESHLEARALIAHSPVSGTNGGVALRAVLAHADGWSLGAGYAVADEAEPPRAPTRVVTRSLGVAYAAGGWGLRLDWEHEDRRDDWVRDGLSAGLHRRW